MSAVIYACGLLGLVDLNGRCEGERGAKCQPSGSVKRAIAARSLAVTVLGADDEDLQATDGGSWSAECLIGSVGAVIQKSIPAPEWVAHARCDFRPSVSHARH